MAAVKLLVDLLPSKSAKIVAALTLPAAGFASLLLDSLGPLMPGLAPPNLVLWKVAAFLLVAELGMIVTIAIVVFQFSRKAPTWPQERYTNLSPPERVLLALASITKPTVVKISREALMADDAVEHWIAHYRQAGAIAPNLPLRLTDQGYKLAVNV